MTEEESGTDSTADYCRNCGLELRGRYCYGCSQDRTLESLSFGKWLGDIIAEFTSLEGRSLKTVVVLLTRPGMLTVAWREGRRVRYTGPLRLFLISLVLLLLIRSLLGSPPGFLLSAVFGFLEGAGAEFDESVVLIQTDRILRGFTLVLAPAIAAVISLFFKKGTFSDHLVFTVHVMAFTLFLRIVFSFVELFTSSDYFTEPIQIIGVLVYAFLAMCSVYGESRLRTALKFVGISGLSFVIWFLTGLAIIAAIGLF